MCLDIHWLCPGGCGSPIDIVTPAPNDLKIPCKEKYCYKPESRWMRIKPEYLGDFMCYEEKCPFSKEYQERVAAMENAVRTQAPDARNIVDQLKEAGIAYNIHDYPNWPELVMYSPVSTSPSPVPMDPETEIEPAASSHEADEATASDQNQMANEPAVVIPSEDVDNTTANGQTQTANQPAGIAPSDVADDATAIDQDRMVTQPVASAAVPATQSAVVSQAVPRRRPRNFTQQERDDLVDMVKVQHLSYKQIRRNDPRFSDRTEHVLSTTVSREMKRRRNGGTTRH